MDNTKIVFVDLDGTLKDSSQKISMRNKKIFEKLASKGIAVVLTTGRNLPYTVSLSKQFSASNYVITSNGAEIYNYLNNNVVYNSKITKENIDLLDSLIKKYDLFFIANCLLKSYTNKTFDEPGKRIVSSLSEITEDSISQVIIESHDIKKMAMFRNEIKDNKDLCIVNKTKNPETSEKILFYDVVSSGVSKGNAIRVLCDYLGIDLDKTMAIGDSENDIEMLETVNVKVAMENSTEDLKSKANYITCSNDQDGVAVILERLYESITM